MTRIPIINVIVTLKIHSEVESSPRKVEVNYGEFNHKAFSAIVVNGETVMLDGDEPVILSTTAKAVEILPLGAIDILAAVLHDEMVYIKKIDAVPEGREREVLESMIKMS